MANSLTGDFEAILEVSGTTVNRLLASMHQNAGSKPELPGFPHTVRLRIGDPDPIDGMVGWISAQVSVPHIDLIHGVTDTFWLEVSVRARYKSDPGSVPLPEFINGTIRAQYRIESIDPDCWGWEKIASDFLWIRVIGDTVSFTGTAVDDTSVISAVQTSIDPSTADARITQLARHLLSKQFEATPHKVSKRFKRGAMRSLNSGTNKSLVAIPIALSTDPSPGKIESINQDILEGRDVGIAISGQFIIGKIQEGLEALTQSFRMIYHFRNRTDFDLGFTGFKVLEANIDWTITLTSPAAKWIGGIPPMMGASFPGGLIEITVKGHARTQKTYLNFDFAVTQTVMIIFDAPKETFTAAPFGLAKVELPAIVDFIASEAGPQIADAFGGAVKAAATGMAGELSLTNRKTDLVTQLKTMDDMANVVFTNAVFTADGVVVRGNISLSPRRQALTTFDFTFTKDGYSAFESWIPGGRIDSFSWTWKWFNNGGKSGSNSETDRYVLRRPAASGQGKFGMVMGINRPLPGLDGMGQVCLVISGTRVHPVTGALTPIVITRKCRKFGFDLSLPTPDRLFLREWKPGPRDPIGPVAESAIHEVGTRAAKGHGANTLIVRAGSEWNKKAQTALRDGLADCRRRDAGLVVIVLFSDGRLMESGAKIMEEMRALEAELEAPLVVNEDVDGSWSKALRITEQDGFEWRLVSPTGGVMWAHSGPLGARDLAHALDDFLFPSPAPRVSHHPEGMPVHTRIPSHAFESDIAGLLSRVDDSCPPPPFERIGLQTAVKFIKKNSASSEAEIRALKKSRNPRENADEISIIVLDGGTAEDARRMRDNAAGAMVVADPDGTIARRFGISAWPSSLRINESGAVSELEVTDDE